MKTNILHFLLFKESRKVSFGLWLFIVATVLLRATLITANDWMLCMGAASTLIGGGTLADKFMDKKPNAPIPPTA